MSRTTTEWADILKAVNVREATADKWSPIFAEVIQDDTFSAGDSEIDDFLAQIVHESGGLERLEEGLYYKTTGKLIATWPTRFKTLEDELPYLRNPEALANKVYGGRMGNVNKGDGWRNRGSGLIQVTGADNLRALQEATGIPVFDNPQLLREPTAECLRVCIAWWEGNVPDSVMGDAKKVRKAVNGGLIGLDDTRVLTGQAERAMA